jgi:lysyl-tRNA synthetase class 2
MTTQEEHALIAQRRAKLNALREAGNAFPNDFRRDVIAGELHAEYDEKDNDMLEAAPVRVKVAGRLMAKRVMGKASFATVQDMSGRIQLFLQRDALPEGVYRTSRLGHRRYRGCRGCAVPDQNR